MFGGIGYMACLADDLSVFTRCGRAGIRHPPVPQFPFPERRSTCGAAKPVAVMEKGVIPGRGYFYSLRVASAHRRIRYIVVLI